MSLSTIVGWKLRATWSDWKPVLTSLPNQAVEAAQHGLEVTQQAARSATGKMRRQASGTPATAAAGTAASASAGGSVASAAGGSSISSSKLTILPASGSPPDALPSSLTTAAASGSSWGSKLASGLKDTWRNGKTGGGATSSKEEEKEQRTFLIPAGTPKASLDDDHDGGLPSGKGKKKSKSGSKSRPAPTGGFSFDDDDDDDADDTSSFTEEPTRPNRKSSSSQSAAAAASHSTAALSSAVAPRSSNPSPRPRNTSSHSSNGSSSAAAAEHFAALPKIQSTGMIPPPTIPSASASSTSSSHSHSHRDPVHSQLLLQSSLESQQDEILDSMSSTIARLSEIQGDIGKELTVQQAELELLDEEMDEAGGKFEIIEKKMQKLLKRSSWSHYKIICCMVTFIFFLLFLIIFL